MATDAIAATIAAFTTGMAAEYSLPVLPRCSRPHHFGRLAATLLIFGPRCTRPDLNRRERQEFRTVEGRNIATADKFAITRQLH